MGREMAYSIILDAFDNICGGDEPFYIGAFALYSRATGGCMDKISKAWRTLEKDDPDAIDLMLGQFLG